MGVIRLLQPDASNALQLGISFPGSSDPARVCTSPPGLIADDVRDVHSFVIEPAMFGYTATQRPASGNGAQSDVANTLAHELGHTLMLSHGDAR